MANIINASDVDRVLRIIDSLVDHVPEETRSELEALRSLLQSPLIHQHLDQHAIQQITELSNSGGDVRKFCETLQSLKQSQLELESCSNVGTLEEDCLGDETLIGSPSTTLRQDTSSASSARSPDPAKRKVSIQKMTITLERESGESLGFDVAGTSPGPVRVFVEQIKPGGLADRDGRLKRGDEIIAINGESITENEGGSEAMQQVLMKIGQQTGSVVFTIKRKLEPAEEQPPSAAPRPDYPEIPEREPNSLSLGRRTLFFEQDGTILRPMLCVLNHIPESGLGFSIIDDVYGNVKINTILPDGPADREGALRPTDLLLEINEAMVRGLNQAQIARLLHCALPNVTLLVGRPVELELDKVVTTLQDVTWGEPPEYCKTTGGITVVSSPTDLSVYPGDVIVKINEIPVELLSESQLSHLKGAAQDVTIYRNNKPTFCENGETCDMTIEMTDSIDKDANKEARKSVWEPNIQIIEFEKRNKTLGLSILPILDPLKPSRSVIVIDHVQEDSGLTDIVKPGSMLTSVNDHVFNGCSFHIVTKVMKMTPSGPVRMGITPLVAQPAVLSDSDGHVIPQSVITVSYNADFPGITLKPSPHSIVPGFVVCSILPGGLFDLDGRLKTGDIIVTLNYAETYRMSLSCIRRMVEVSCKSDSLLRVSYVTREEATQEYTVTVPRHPKTGIGISIVGGATPENPVNGIFIKKIVDIKSTLKKGEQIIKVNDIPMSGLSHVEAVEVLKTATSPLTLTLQSPSKGGSAPSTGGPETLQDDVFQVCLPRTGEALGMKLGTCEQGLILTHVEENSVADVVGLASGDVIYKVNETVLRGVPQDMMMPILRQQDGPTNINVIRKPPRKSQVTPINTAPTTPTLDQPPDHAMIQVHHNLDRRTPPPYSPSPGPDTGHKVAAQNAFTVHIKKSGTTSLGINVIQRGSGIFIKNIVADFPASQCEKLKPGDQILAVNEDPLTGMSRNKAIAVLRKVEGDVTLLITRSSVAVANVLGSSSDKENSPSSRSSSPFVVELELAPGLQSQPGPPSRDSSEHPDIPALRRTDNMTPDNISLRSANSSKSLSHHNSRHSVNDHDTPTPSVHSNQLGGSNHSNHGGYSNHSNHDGSNHGRTPTGSLRSSQHDRISQAEDPIRPSPSKTEILKSDSQRSSPILRRKELLGEGTGSTSSDRRISWHDSPIEVDTVPITLHTKDSGSGIILYSQPHPDGILVKSITSNSPATQLVWPQDLIIQINQLTTKDMAVSDAAILLSDKKSDINVEVKRDCPLYQSFNVILEKPKSGSLGLSITERKSNPGIYISQVTPGGVAEKHGVIVRGQRILKINGEDVKYMQQKSFVSILQGCGKKVELTVGTPARETPQRQSPAPRYSPSLQRSAGSRNSGERRAGSPYSSQRSTTPSSRSGLRQSPPPSPLVYTQRASPHGSPRLSNRVYHGASPQGSPRGSLRSTNTPTGAPLEGSRRDHGSLRSDQHQGSGSLLRDQHQGSGSLLRDQHQGSGSLLRDQHQGSGSLLRDQHQGSGSLLRDQYSEHHQSTGSLRGQYLDHHDSGSLKDYQGSLRDQYSDHGGGYDHPPRDFDYPSGDRYNQGGYNQRSGTDYHRSDQFVPSPHGSLRDLDQGSSRSSRGRNGETGSVRSSVQSVDSRGIRRKPRHQSPTRSTNSLQSRKSDRLDARADSLTHFSVQSLQSDYHPPHSIHSISTHSLHSADSRSIDARSNVSTGSFPRPSTLRTANLHREQSTPLGLSLAGGKGWPLGSSIPLFINALQKGGIAARAGVLKEKDRIVSINGTNVEDFSHEDAVTLLREATSPVTLVVTDPDTHGGNRPDFRMVKLTRARDGFGFTIVGGKDNITSIPITIKTVYEDGPAFGKLRRGDQIISVNGKSIEEYTREEATLLLQSCTETVTLVVQ